MKKVLYEYERIIYKSHLYKEWLSLHEKERIYIRTKLSSIILKYLLKDLWLAIAKDILCNERINTESNIYKYIHRYIFKRNTRKMLVFLQDLVIKDK